MQSLVANNFSELSLKLFEEIKKANFPSPVFVRSRAEKQSLLNLGESAAEPIEINLFSTERFYQWLPRFYARPLYVPSRLELALFLLKTAQHDFIIDSSPCQSLLLDQADQILLSLLQQTKAPLGDFLIRQTKSARKQHYKELLKQNKPEWMLPENIDPDLLLTEDIILHFFGFFCFEPDIRKVLSQFTCYEYQIKTATKGSRSFVTTEATSRATSARDLLGTLQNNATQEQIPFNQMQILVIDPARHLSLLKTLAMAHEIPLYFDEPLPPPCHEEIERFIRLWIKVVQKKCALSSVVALWELESFAAHWALSQEELQWWLFWAQTLAIEEGLYEEESGSNSSWEAGLQRLALALAMEAPLPEQPLKEMARYIPAPLEIEVSQRVALDKFLLFFNELETLFHFNPMRPLKAWIEWIKKTTEIMMGIDPDGCGFFGDTKKSMELCGDEDPPLTIEALLWWINHQRTAQNSIEPDPPPNKDAVLVRILGQGGSLPCQKLYLLGADEYSYQQHITEGYENPALATLLLKQIEHSLLSSDDAYASYQGWDPLDQRPQGIATAIKNLCANKMISLSHEKKAPIGAVEPPSPVIMIQKPARKKEWRIQELLKVCKDPAEFFIRENYRLKERFISNRLKRFEPRFVIPASYRLVSTLSAIAYWIEKQGLAPHSTLILAALKQEAARYGHLYEESWFCVELLPGLLQPLERFSRSWIFPALVVEKNLSSKIWISGRLEPLGAQGLFVPKARTGKTWKELWPLTLLLNGIMPLTGCPTQLCFEEEKKNSAQIPNWQERLSDLLSYAHRCLEKPSPLLPEKQTAEDLTQSQQGVAIKNFARSWCQKRGAWLADNGSEWTRWEEKIFEPLPRTSRSRDNTEAIDG